MSQSEKNHTYTVFISYRRADTAMAAGRIDDFLSVYFNRAQIFRDVREIGLGNKFPERLRQALAQSRVLLVVIGEKWLTLSHESGRRRIDDVNDWVRVEIRTALESGITIIPLLIDNAQMPRKEDLPEDLQTMSDWQALRVRADTFTYDMLFLREYLEQVEKLEPNEQHPHIEELRELAIEEFRDHLFDGNHKEDVEWLKDILRDEIIQEYYDEVQGEMDFERRREEGL